MFFSFVSSDLLHHRGRLFSERRQRCYVLCRIPHAVFCGLRCFSMICADGFTREQTARRLARKKYGDALTLFGSVLRFSFVCAAGTFVVFYLGSGILGKAVLGNALFAPILRAFTPALVLLPFLGAMKGFLHGIGKDALPGQRFGFSRFFMLCWGRFSV